MPPRKSAATKAVEVADDQMGFDVLAQPSQAPAVTAVPDPEPEPSATDHSDPADATPDPEPARVMTVVPVEPAVDDPCDEHGLVDCEACYAVEEVEPDPEPMPVVGKSDEIDQGLALFDVAPDPTAMSKSLIDEYRVPPFSVFDTRQHYWQDRKRTWIAYGIKSEIGRDEKLTYGKFNQDYEAKTRAEWEALNTDTTMSDEEKDKKRHELTKARALNPHTVKRYGGGSTSIFDPVLTEIMYRWLCPPGGVVLDPFAGGSVRGIVAAFLGRRYTGIELRDVQVEANREQARTIVDASLCPVPTWIAGDSKAVLEKPDLPAADFVFTCPPYADLEVYSDDPRDLSKMPAKDFDMAYMEILAKSADRLADDRFAAVVISNVRDPKTGHIRDLIKLTCDGMLIGGAHRYNESILLNVAGTAALRARKQFNTSRKLVGVHQHCLVFVKGDPRKAAEAVGNSEYIVKADDADG